ncbi:hypothetical protein [Azospirillum rugosum]|uniref:hypothetical protein n=1 Tax=Azospirillum rugosum TaxID=416170 RepID=UPI003623047B
MAFRWLPTYRADGRRSDGICLLDGAWRAEVLAPSHADVGWLIEHRFRVVAKGRSPSIAEAQEAIVTVIQSLRPRRCRTKRNATRRAAWMLVLASGMAE